MCACVCRGSHLSDQVAGVLRLVLLGAAGGVGVVGKATAASMAPEGEGGGGTGPERPKLRSRLLIM